jgi:hypothetical protein
VASNILSELLFFSPSLERLSVKMSNYSDEEVKIRPQSPTILSSVQYFHLEDISIDLSSLFFVVPMLHTLEVRFYNLVWAFSNIHPQPLHLQRLRIHLWFNRWTRMVYLLSSFPRLTYLTVIGENLGIGMADGFAWAQLLKDIEHFEFSLQFHWIGYVEQSFVLESFRTKFWLEEKKWFVTYDQNLTDDYSILYTNSSSVSNYPSHSMIGLILSESTGSQPTSFPHVHCLTINYQNVKRALLHRYTHITELKLSQIDTTFPPTFKDLITYLDTSRIITCSVSSEWIGKSPHELTEFLRSLPRLRTLSVSVYVLNYLYRHRWPDIIHLRIENNDEDNFQLLSSNEINTLYRSFTHIERLDIHSESVIDLPRFLNRIKRKTLTEIIIRQQRKVRNEHLITREWIEQNTELQHFHYARDAMNSVISLWF